MLLAAVALLSAAALGGVVWVVLSQNSRYARLRWPGAVHGAIGIAGFAALIAGLRGPVRGAEEGAGSFGLVAAGLVGAAVLLASLLLAARLRHRAPSTLAIGAHATVAICGWVMLLAYVTA